MPPMSCTSKWTMFQVYRLVADVKMSLPLSHPARRILHHGKGLGQNLVEPALLLGSSSIFESSLLPPASLGARSSSSLSFW